MSNTIKMKTVSIYIDALNKHVIYHIGINAADNFAVIDSATSPEDVWFHVGNGLPSCHVLGLMPDCTKKLDKKLLRYIIKQGAILCKQYSKYASEKGVEIHYSAIKNVTKTANPGSVILSSYSTLHI